MPGPVSAPHAEFEDDCQSCHSPLDDKPQFELCVACHAEVGADLQSQRGFHGKHPEVGVQECQACHAEHEGREAQTLEFDMSSFNHDDTDFPLRWGHSGIACESCHAPETKFSQAPAQCAACHEDPHENTLGSMCESCHSQRDWQPSLFDHSQTAFPLTAAHANVECAACHEDKAFTGAATACASCHAKDDTHRGSMGNQCASCHTTSSWYESFFNHDSTGFALTGAHGALTCATCHVSAQPLQSSTCQSCHAKDDVHQGMNGTACASCHTTEDWQRSTFDHFASSGFALVGAHADASCGACHESALTDPIPSTCDACHDDPHETQLGGMCATCHGQAGWKVAVRFDHDLIGFPLLGRHAGLLCADCHATSRFHDSPTQCAACHSQDDPHEQSLGDDCASCHNPSSWQATKFSHAADTGFALAGAHATLSCAACHASQQCTGTNSADCAACHVADDAHDKRFGSQCARCHTTNAWSELTRF